MTARGREERKLSPFSYRKSRVLRVCILEAIMITKRDKPTRISLALRRKAEEWKEEEEQEDKEKEET